MLPSASTGWVWPLGQDPAQWSSIMNAMRQGQGGGAPSPQPAGIPGVTQPGGDIPGVPGVARGQDPGLPRGEAPSLPNQPSDTTRNLQLALQAARTGRSVLDLGNIFAQSPQIAQASGGAGAVTGGLGAGLNFAQGNYTPGTLQLLQSLVQSGKVANQVFAPSAAEFGEAANKAGALGTTGTGLLRAAGGLLGLAGAGYGLSQGDPHAIAGIPSGAGQVAGGAATLGGYTPLGLGAAGAGTTAAGPGTAALASGALGTIAAEQGTTAAAATALGTLGEALGPLGLVLALGPVIDILANTFQDKWKTGLPELGQSAMNPTSTKSMLTGINAADFLRQNMGQASLNDLFGLASRGLTQNGELQFRNQFGDYNNPQYADLLRRAQAGDPQAIQEFVKGIQVYSGEAGAAKPNDLVTDAYQRNLVSRLSPMLQAQLMQDPGLFKVTQDYPGQNELAQVQQEIARQRAMGQLGATGGPDPYGGLLNSLQLSPLFRSAENRQATQDMATQAQWGTLPYQDLYQDPYYAQFEPYTHPQSQE